MLCDEAHIRRASSATVCACASKRPAIARIACGSVINRVGTTPLLPNKTQGSIHAPRHTTSGSAAAAKLAICAVSPPPYPTPVRGTTLGRFCTTWFGLAPPRPIIPPGMPPPPAPIGIGIGIIPVPAPPPIAPAIPAGISPPSPDIAALTIRAGDDPCHVGGTDIAPTNRAWPKLPAPPPKPPRPPPPSPLGTVSPTNFGVSAPTNPAAPVPASALQFAPLIPAWAAIMIGDIAMLAGCMTIWDSCDICETGADEANADTSDTAGETADTTGANTGDNADVNAVPPEVPSPASCDDTPASGVEANNPVKPARLAGGKLNDGNAEATDAAPE